MKNLNPLLICLLFCFMGFTTENELAEEKILIEGVWDLLIAKEITGNDTTIAMIKDADNHQIKMFMDNYFMFNGRGLYKNDTIDIYGGGTYTLEGNKYIEKVVYHMHSSEIGKTFEFDVMVNGDTLVQKGGRVFGETKIEFIETFIRVK